VLVGHAEAFAYCRALAVSTAIEVGDRAAGPSLPARAPTDLQANRILGTHTLAPGSRAGLQRPATNALVGTGRMLARAVEPETAIEVERLEPPYDRHTAVGQLRSALPVGPYRCRFRLGNEVFSEHDVIVEEGQTVRLRPSITASPLVAEALGVDPARASSVLPSEKIGPMQSRVLATLLPLVAGKPFDRKNELLGKFGDFVDHRDRDEFGDRPLVIVIAVDGEPWRSHPTGARRGPSEPHHPRPRRSPSFGHWDQAQTEV
jgi:hypothetical protein